MANNEITSTSAAWYQCDRCGSDDLVMEQWVEIRTSGKLPADDLHDWRSTGEPEIYENLDDVHEPRVYCGNCIRDVERPVSS